MKKNILWLSNGALVLLLLLALIATMAWSSAHNLRSIVDWKKRIELARDVALLFSKNSVAQDEKRSLEELLHSGAISAETARLLESKEIIFLREPESGPDDRVVCIVPGKNQFAIIRRSGAVEIFGTHN